MAHRYDICRATQTNSVKLVILLSVNVSAQLRRACELLQSPHAGESASVRSSGSRPRTVASTVTAAVVSAVNCALLARYWWVADLAVHFRIQYAITALAGSAVLAAFGRPLWALVALAVCTVNALTVWADLKRCAAAADAGTARAPRLAFRVAALNVFYRNPDPARALAWLRAAQPDAAILLEITPRWRTALADLSKEFPHQHYAVASLQRVGGPVERGALLLSRWPIEHAETVALGAHTEPAIAATLTVSEHSVRVIGVHTCWPLGRAVSAERNQQLLQLAGLARATSVPLVVAGDLNISPFSPHYQSLIATSGLRSAARSTPWQPTWPTFLPPGGIHIDHVLVSGLISVRRFRRGPAIGSDHLPVLADLTIGI